MKNPLSSKKDRGLGELMPCGALLGDVTRSSFAMGQNAA